MQRRAVFARERWAPIQAGSRRRRARGPSSLAGALLALTLVAATPSHPDRPPVVLVSGGPRFGSGIVWSAADGLVLTTLHVVERMPEIRVSVNGLPAARARVVDLDRGLDLALLRAERPLPGTPRVARRATGVRGQRVTLLGFPRRRESAMSATILDAHRRFAGARYLELGARAEPGDSGGAVLDARGAVVGVVDIALMRRGTTLAIPLDAALTRFPRRPAGGDAGRVARSQPATRPVAGATQVHGARRGRG